MSRLVAIGSYIPQGRVDNRALKNKFDVTEDFLSDKLGVLRTARRGPGEDTAALCAAAFRDLAGRTGLDANTIDAVVVVTQNPDRAGLPHTAAAVHAAIGAPQHCAAFDVGQGCAGFVYGLAVVDGLLAAASLRHAVLFTCDPYSKIIDPEDRNTAMLFGDAATATLVVAAGSDDGWQPSHFRFLALSGERDVLENRDGHLYMNGRGVFNFAAGHVPREIDAVLKAAGATREEIDLYVLHQGSKYIIDALCRRMGLPAERVPYDILDYGNTVSSSIPLLLKDRLADGRFKRMLLCGFGVGLSAATCILSRTD